MAEVTGEPQLCERMRRFEASVILDPACDLVAAECRKSQCCESPNGFAVECRDGKVVRVPASEIPGDASFPPES